MIRGFHRLAIASCLLATLAGCNSKIAACKESIKVLDQRTRDLDSAAALEPHTPAPGDPVACAKFGEAAERLEAATASLAAHKPADEGLATRVGTYADHVASWAAADRRAQTACNARNGKAMLDAMGEGFHHSAQIQFAIAEVNSYCRAR